LLEKNSPPPPHPTSPLIVQKSEPPSYLGILTDILNITSTKTRNENNELIQKVTKDKEGTDDITPIKITVSRGAMDGRHAIYDVKHRNIIHIIYYYIINCTIYFRLLLLMLQTSDHCTYQNNLRTTDNLH
jgi:hypothetical protein